MHYKYIYRTRVQPGAALPTPLYLGHSLVYTLSHPLPLMALQRRQAQRVRNLDFSHKIEIVSQA